MWSKIVRTLLLKRLRNSPTIQETVERTASNHLEKESKLDVAADAVFTHDLRELAAAERERVAAYMSAKVPGLARTKGKEVPGDFIVCDDYRKGLGPVPAVLMTIVALVAIVASSFVAWSQLQPDVETPATVEAVDTTTQIEIE